ncbi:hypothetical protein PQX77_003812 [Marasmius sp. AFHP31]|nr:hypothetical protein PQX77_003812 [Marasmius sp. AFHP31]
MSAYKRIQRKVVQLINDPNFDLQLPPLSRDSWRKIDGDGLERDRLEFLGDALMSSFVAQNLYRSLSEGTAHYYSQARSALTANETFAHIMARLGYFDMKGPIKPAGDAFESIIGAFHAERGQEALQRWQEQYFLPLISCAANVCRTLKVEDKRKRKAKLKGPKANHILARLRRERTPNIISPLRDRKARGLAPSPSIRMPKSFKVKSRLPPPIVDLTADSEPEEDACASSSEVVEICARDYQASQTASTRSAGPSTGTNSINILSAVALNIAQAGPSTPVPVRRLPLTPTPGGADNPIIID